MLWERRVKKEDARVLNSRGGLLRVRAKRTTRECQADSKRTRRTRFKTTPLFCLSYTDVLMKQRRCFKEVPAKWWIAVGSLKETFFAA